MTTDPPTPKKKETKFCSECGEKILRKAEICPRCGVRQHDVESAAHDKPKLERNVAGLLAIFLGWIGVHKFYMGKTGIGLLYLVLCWTAVPAILGVLEGITYFSMSEADFDKKYNK